jgi:transcription initiation factor IIE alpha subunit
MAEKKKKEKTEESQEKKAAQKFRIGFKCAQAGGMVYAESVGSEFECPVCKSPMKYEHNAMRLTSTADIRHEIRKVVEVNRV